MTSRPLPLPQLGVDLLSDETQMPFGTVRRAVNVDIDRQGQFRRRGGWQAGLPGEWQSLHAWGGALLAQRSAEVLMIDPDTLDGRVICELGSPAPVDFHEYNGDLYLCNPSGLWRLRPGHMQTAARAGVWLPDAAPTLEATQAGTLTPGRYTVALSLVDAVGEESPAAAIGSVQAERGLRLQGLPLVSGHRWRVYVSPPDGDTLYLAEEFDAVWTQYAVTVYPGGTPCETLHRANMPGGRFVRGWAGRLYVARGSTLWYSDALRPHLTALHHNFVPFVGQIRLLEFVAGGAFVGDDRGVWWLAGPDPSEWRAELVSRAQVVTRSGLVLPTHEMRVLESSLAQDCVLWLSTAGHMAGSPDGSVTAINSDRVRLAPGQTGRSSLIQRDGVTQAITLTASPGPAHIFGAAVDTKGTP